MLNPVPMNVVKVIFEMLSLTPVNLLVSDQVALYVPDFVSPISGIILLGTKSSAIKNIFPSVLFVLQ